MEMNIYKANASVIYTDEEGRQIDTFVIFDSNPGTGITHINYHNLEVAADSLNIHPKTVGNYHLPLADAFSFEMFRKLRDKYEALDAEKVASKPQLPMHVVVDNLEINIRTAAA